MSATSLAQAVSTSSHSSNRSDGVKSSWQEVYFSIRIELIYTKIIKV